MTDTINDKKKHEQILDPTDEGDSRSMDQEDESGSNENFSAILREKEELEQKILRLAADYENYKKRSLRDVEDARFQMKDRLLRDLLPVFDGLDLALDAVHSSTGIAASPLLDGVKMVQKQFLAAFERFDIVPIDAFEKPFDPQLHEAVQQIPAGSLAPGIVAKVLRRGFISGNRLLRPSMVVVTKASSVD